MSDDLSNCNCALERVLNRGFGAFNFDDKVAINELQPKRDIAIKTQTKKCVRHFGETFYEKNPWLSGCNQTKKLYCWPCVLFSTNAGVWLRSGFDDLNNFHKSAKRHTSTNDHISCMKAWKTFGKNRIENSTNSQRQIAIEAHNRQVKKNRKIFTSLIRTTCFLGKQGLAFRGHRENEDSINRGNYIELAYEFAAFDDDLLDHFENATVFSGLSGDIQNDIIDSISEKMTHIIKNEISQAKFVSIILDETTDISMKSQLSHVLRYVTEDGVIRERFICFTDVSRNRTASGLFEDIINFLSSFGCEEKLIAQTYDGAAVMAGEHNGLQAKIKERCNNAIFVHCYAHKLNLVLSQSTRGIPQCNVFFTTLSAFGTFFNKSTKRTVALDDEVKKRFPTAAPTRWNYNSRIVQTIYENRTSIHALLQSMIKGDWDGETKNSAQGLITTLQRQDFQFLLIVFNRVFLKTDILFKFLQNKWANVSMCVTKMKEFRNELCKLRENFADIWMEYKENNPESTSRPRRNCDEEIVYRQLYFEIIDCITTHLDDRFSDLPKLKFVELVNVENYENYAIKFPQEAFESVKENFGQHFDFVTLKSELSVIYSDCDSKSKNAYELLQYI